MRLLIIEDEPDLLSGLSRALRRTGYSVDTAADGDEIKAKIARGLARYRKALAAAQDR